MKNINYLLLLPIALLVAIMVSSCSGLTDEEKQFVGEWSSVSTSDTLMDKDLNLRMIYTAYDKMNYHEDHTYDDSMDAMIKLETNYSDGSVRLYYFIHGNFTCYWSAKDGVYCDSTITADIKDVVAPNNVVAVKFKGADKVERFSINDFPDYVDESVSSYLKELYNGESKTFKEVWNDKSKSVYKIISLGKDQIVYEDNDGEKDTLTRGDVMSPKVQQMMSEGEALK